jgi:hypothetical protein
MMNATGISSCANIAAGKRKGAAVMHAGTIPANAGTMERDSIKRKALRQAFKASVLLSIDA